MSDRIEQFIHHLLQVDPRNSYDAESRKARVFLQVGAEASALFQLDPEAVTAYLDRLMLDATSLWPEAPVDLRAFRLLAIHMMESVLDDPDEVFSVTPTGIATSGG